MSQRLRSCSSSGTRPPAASTRAARRACCSRISASSPTASGSSGISRTSTPASRIASAARSGRSKSAPAVAAYPSVNSRYSTASTAEVRSGSRCGGGTRKGMPAWRIFCLARTRRLAMVCSLTRNALAISAVLSPARVRRVSATWAGTASAGWQQVNINRSRSSGTASSSSVGGSGAGDRAAASWSLAAPSASRRSRSTARLRAVVVSQAPGRRGTPSRGQVRRARAKASWAQSSARSQSPVSRMTLATTRPHCSWNALVSAASTALVTASAAAGSRSCRNPRPGAWRRSRSPRPGRRSRSGRTRRSAPWSRRTGRR